MKIRVGQGFDVHAMVPGRRLVIGGVEIAHERGLLGHSDADVLLHAITDAILGAAALGDIGRLFPDHDPKFRDADSRALLRSAVARAGTAGWRIGNVDATVIAERPRIGPHVAAMCAAIAAECGIDAGAVNVKGKTSEKLGYLGRGEGIAAQAVVLLFAD
jgi:2-C-methyl-D-erythritol 2,4-cyclodiphosphate synthase